MKSWFPNAAKAQSIAVPIILGNDELLVISAAEKRESEEKSLQERIERLETHNSTHGKNVVFWSCKRCFPVPICQFTHLQHPWKDGCTDPESEGVCRAKSLTK